MDRVIPTKLVPLVPIVPIIPVVPIFPIGQRARWVHTKVKWVFNAILLAESEEGFLQQLGVGGLTILTNPWKFLPEADQAGHWSDISSKLYDAVLDVDLTKAGPLLEALRGKEDGLSICFDLLWSHREEIGYKEAQAGQVDEVTKLQFKMPRSQPKDAIFPDSGMPGPWYDVNYPWASGRTAYVLNMAIQLLNKIWDAYGSSPSSDLYIPWHQIVSILCYAGVRKGIPAPSKEQSLSTWLRLNVYPKHPMVAQIALHFLDDLPNTQHRLMLPLDLKLDNQSMQHLNVSVSFLTDEEIRQWPDTPMLASGYTWDASAQGITKFALRHFLRFLSRWSNPGVYHHAMGVPICLYAAGFRNYKAINDSGSLEAFLAQVKSTTYFARASKDNLDWPNGVVGTIPSSDDIWIEIYDHASDLYSGDSEIRSQQILIDMKRYIKGTGVDTVDHKDQKYRLEAIINYTNLGDLKDILGDLDDYTVNESSSIFSPSAYLTELLRFLPVNARQVLLQRRPDLNTLLLTQANTNTSLPYLDTANEIMAEKIWTIYKALWPADHPGPTPGIISSQGSGVNTAEDADVEDLRGTPSNQLPTLQNLESVYTMRPFTTTTSGDGMHEWACSVRLPSAPFSALPYDVGVHEMKLLLESFNMSRYELMRGFRNPWAIPIAALDEGDVVGSSSSLLSAHAGDWKAWNTESGLEVALNAHGEDLVRLQTAAILRALQAETLGLLPMDFLAITGEGFWDLDFWNLQWANEEASLSETGVELALKPLPPTATLWGYPSRTSTGGMLDDNEQDYILSLEHGFLPRSGLDYNEYVSLVKSYSIGRYNKLEDRLFKDNVDPVKFTPLDAQYTLEFSENDEVDVVLRGIQAFIRLGTRSGVSIVDLDTALHIWDGYNSGAGLIKPDFISKLAMIKEIKGLTGIGYSRLLVLWSDLAVTGNYQLSNEVFGGRGTRRLDPQFYAWITNEFISLDAISPDLKDHVPALLTSLGIGQRAFDAIAEARGIDTSQGGSAPLSAETLSILLRYTVLCQCFGVSPENISTLLAVFPDVLVAPPVSQSSTLDLIADSPDTLLRYLQQWEKISQAGIKLEELAALVLDAEDVDPINNDTSTQEYFRKVTFEMAMEFQSLARKFPATVESSTALAEVEGLLNNVVEASDAEAILEFLRGAIDIDELELASDVYAIKDHLQSLSGTDEQPGAAELATALYQYLAPHVLSAEQNRTVSGSLSVMSEANTGAMLELALGFISGSEESAKTKIQELVDSLASPFQQTDAEDEAWSGYFSPESSGQYSFEFSSAQVSQVFVDDVPLGWDEASEGTATKSISLSAEKAHGLRLQSRQNSPVLRLWSLGSSKVVDISRGTFVPSSTIANVAKTVQNLRRITSPINTLELTTEEVVFWQWHGDARRLLPDDGSGAPENLPGLYYPWGTRHSPVDFNTFNRSSIEQLCDYSLLKKELETQGFSTSVEDNTLLRIVKLGAEGEDSLETVSKQVGNLVSVDAGTVELLLRSYGGLNPGTSNSSVDGDMRDDLISGPSSNTYNEHTLSQFLWRLRDIKRLKMDLTSTKTMMQVVRPVSDEISWTASSAMAIKLRQLLRNRVDTNDWNKTILPINDELRRQRRDSMVGLLLRQPELRNEGYRDADGLFEYFFLDVQMDTSLQTSRIKQAISTVQTFIQRAILGLEMALPEGEEGADSTGNKIPIEIDRTKWIWLQKYRVWEANRRVLAYPENWLTAAGLDRKTDLFAQLEEGISKASLSLETFQQYVGEYLQALGDLSRLDYVAYDYSLVPSAPDDAGPSSNAFNSVLMFSKTTTKPHRYMFRTLGRHAGWSQWEPLHADVPICRVGTEKGAPEGSWLVPVQVGNRKLLFLPEVTPVFLDASPGVNDAVATPNDFALGAGFDLTLHWSEMVNGKWTDRQTLDESAKIYASFEGGGPQLRTAIQGLFFTTNTEQDDPNRVPSRIVISAWTNVAASDDEDGYKLLGRFEVLLRQMGVQTDTPADYSSGTFGWNDRPTTVFNTMLVGEGDEEGAVGYVIPSGHLKPVGDYAEQAVVKIAKPAKPNYNPYMVVTAENQTETRLDLFIDPICELLDEASKGDALSSLESVSTDRLGLSGADFGGLTTEDGREFDFDIHSQPWSAYYWDLGFFIPMLAAERFLESQQFDNALAAIQVVFDPRAPVPGSTDESAHWKFLPFRQYSSASVDTVIKTMLNFTPAGRHLDVWSDKPFQPHVAARANISSYMSWVAIKYTEILVAYGDFYFRQDTLETIPSAIQCYVEASQAIGKKPRLFPRPNRTFISVQELRDGGSGAVEALLEVIEQPALDSPVKRESWLGAKTLASNYFGTPANPKLGQVRDTIEDRLFKIRHSIDINGNVRTLSLFEPAIDPALLIAAAAGGSLQLSNVLGELNAPLVNVRFAKLLQKAKMICKRDLPAIGRLLLGTMQARDGQELANIVARQARETEELRLVMTKIQKESATQTKDVLLARRSKLREQLMDFFQLLGISTDGRLPQDGDGEDGNQPFHHDHISPEITDEFPDNQVGVERRTKHEIDGDEQHEKVVASKRRQHNLKGALYFLSMFPPEADWSSSVELLGVTNGGALEWDFADALRAFSDSVFHFQEAKIITEEKQRDENYRVGGRVARLREWKMQANSLGHDVMELDRQIKVQNTLLRLAEEEIRFQESNLESAREVERFQTVVRQTTPEFYRWLQRSVGDIYFQTYNIAYDLAKKAERAYFFEKGLDRLAVKPIIEAYWDATNNGLLAGEKLLAGLYRLERAFDETRGYDFEITKKVSLASIDPAGLESLRSENTDGEDGAHTATFSIPEQVFDRDFPGHYKRRIKSVAVSVLNTDPRTDLAATLTLVEHQTRVVASLADGGSAEGAGYLPTGPADSRFRREAVPINSIAVSSDEEDSGMFTLHFGGSVGSGFVPFEGAGAVSTWRLEISENTGYNVEGIEDVVIKIKYTAASGTAELKKVVREYVREQIQQMGD